MRSNIEQQDAIIAEWFVDDAKIAGNGKRPYPDVLPNERVIFEQRVSGMLFKKLEAIGSTANEWRAPRNALSIGFFK